ncbi:2-amino-4-hydroxy-6-hydroxymethyldihydropteridine diphosphokinase [Burkholderiaceae bacterium UC74_6]
MSGLALTEAFIGLGANLGDAAAALRSALDKLAHLPRTRLVQASSFYRTAPVDAGGPDYLNAAARIETGLDPHALLDALQAIELDHGRERPYVNAPRTLDLDLLLYGEQHIASARLTVPHPRMLERAFVLQPLLEIAPERRDLQAHLAALADQRIERIQGL